MKNLFPTLVCLLATSTVAFSQTPGSTVAEASAPVAQSVAQSVVPTAPLQKRSFPIRFVGRQLTTGGTLLRSLATNLTENRGSLSYSALTGQLVAEDTQVALDKIAAQLKVCDVPPEQVFLDIRIIQLTNTSSVERALAGTGQDCAQGVALLDSTQVTAVMRRLKQEPAKVIQAPQLVALANEVATIFVGKKTPVVMQPDGGWVSPMTSGSFEICVLPTIDNGTERIRLDLQMRSLLTAADGGVICQPMSVTSGSTVVFQKFATADSGALVMVTPSILRESTPMK